MMPVPVIQPTMLLSATVYCFNLALSAALVHFAADLHVPVVHFNIIYRLVEAMRTALSERLPPVTELQLVGEGHVLKEFMIKDGARKRQPVAGCLIDWGKFHK